MTVNELIESGRERLTPLYGKGETEAMLRIIWEKLKGWQPVDIVMHRDYEPGVSLTADFEDIISRLQRHEPLQYILGEARFFGLTLGVNPSTLIPRPETEGLVQLIVDDFGNTPDLKVVDIGTGSGAIAIALARHLPFAKVEAIDISEDAIATAKENASKLKVKVGFLRRDVLKEGLPPSDYDIVVSNPPYILSSEKKNMAPNVIDFEPHEALFAPSEDDVAFYRVISREAAKCLQAGGKLYFELNPLTAENVKKIVEAEGFDDVMLLRDLHSRIRYLKATKARK